MENDKMIFILSDTVASAKEHAREKQLPLGRYCILSKKKDRMRMKGLRGRGILRLVGMWYHHPDVEGFLLEAHIQEFEIQYA